MNPNKKKISEAIQEAQSFLIVAHLNPDGDAFGSMLALAHALKLLGKKNVEYVCTEGVPHLYKFLSGSENALLKPTLSSYDLAVALDCDGKSRLGDAEPYLDLATKVICIDHHGGNNVFGNISWVDSQAAATGELVFELIKDLQIPIDKPIATSLLTALMSDTGSFRFPNTTAHTFSIAQELLQAGANTSQVSSHLYEEKIFSTVKLQGIALGRLEKSCRDQIVWAYLKLSDYADACAQEEETEGIINQIRSVKGSRVAVLFRETSEGGIKVSLRSRNDLDVSAIARQFGGGGHRLASGCTVQDTLEGAENQILSVLSDALDKEDEMSL